MLELLALFPLLWSQTWTVDDDGPADFPSIEAALASPLVGDGDVLLVSPGSYGAFTVEKAVSLVAAADTRFTADTVTVRDVERFSIAGMHALQELRIERIAGRGHVDDCIVGSVYIEPGGVVPLWTGLTRVLDSSEVVIDRCELHGSDACYPDVSWKGPALRVERSTVAVVQSELFGGNEVAPAGFGWCGDHPVSGSNAAAYALDGSHLVVAASTLRSGNNTFPTSFEYHAALHLVDSTAVVTGSKAHALVGYPPPGAIDGSGASATVSGVTLDPPSLPPWVMVPAVPEPFLAVLTTGGPGAQVSVDLHGVGGGVGVVALSLAPVLLPTAFGLLWLDPLAIPWTAVLPTLGQETPSSAVLLVPADPALAGLSVVFQALAAIPGLPRAATNPSVVVLRW